MMYLLVLNLTAQETFVAGNQDREEIRTVTHPHPVNPTHSFLSSNQWKGAGALGAAGNFLQWPKKSLNERETSYFITKREMMRQAKGKMLGEERRRRYSFLLNNEKGYIKAISETVWHSNSIFNLLFVRS